MNERLKNVLQLMYMWGVIIWFVGIFVLTPVFTAKYTVDVCKKYDPTTVDVYSAATAGLVMGFVWPIRLVVGP
jgi:hypothetical protein